MIVAHLALADFRNYERAEVALAPGPNLFVGRNGQGKTNLIESIGYLSTLGSHRVATDNAMIRAGQESAIVRARLEHGDRQVLVEVQLNRTGANRAQVNRAAIKPRELPRYVSSVLFAPEDLAIVRGEPGGRRRFLDQLLVLRAPRYAGVIADYERVLKQRNTLLKSARGVRNPDLSTLDIWDERLVDLGTELLVARRRLTDELAPEVRSSYAAIAGEEHDVSLALVLSILGGHPDDDGEDDDPDAAGSVDRGADRDALAESFRAALTRMRRAELDRGLTLVGPHRDDLRITLNGLAARSHASHGESWSTALALKLASAQVLRRDSSTGDPVLMLDDVFAELDAGRRQRLAEAARDFEQVLITAAVHDDVPEALRAHTVRIRAGRVLEEGEE